MISLHLKFYLDPLTRTPILFTTIAGNAGMEVLRYAVAQISCNDPVIYNEERGFHFYVKLDKPWSVIDAVTKLGAEEMGLEEAMRLREFVDIRECMFYLKCGIPDTWAKLMDIGSPEFSRYFHRMVRLSYTRDVEALSKEWYDDKLWFDHARDKPTDKTEKKEPWTHAQKLEYRRNQKIIAAAPGRAKRHWRTKAKKA